jgi:hypothetical protein
MSVPGDRICAVDHARLPDLGRIAGLATTAELVDCGLAKPAIRRLVRGGVLFQVRRGVYARADLVSRMSGSKEFRSRRLAIAAAIAVVADDAVASHQDAAMLYGIDLLDRISQSQVTLSRSNRHDALMAGRPAIRVRIASLPADQKTVIGGIPVTTAARTVADLARVTSFKSGVVIADSALHRRLTTKVELSRVLATCARWPGVDRARHVVAFSDGRSESAFESIARVAFRDGGLPPPDLQVWVGGDSGPVGRADFLWREHATIAETDGAFKYADPDRARQQLRRDADLRAAGYEVVHIGWAELTLTPDQVIRAITAAFARSAGLWQGERLERHSA